MIEKIKFRFIEYLNDKNEDYCWASLVCWAVSYRSFWSLFFKSHIEYDYKTQTCRPESESFAYCGKCQKYFEDKNEIIKAN